MRLGIVTGKGLLTLVRERYGQGAAGLVLGALVVANTGTLCAEFAGVAAAMDLLGGMSRYLNVPLAAAGSRPWSCARTSAMSSTSSWP